MWSFDDVEILPEDIKNKVSDEDIYSYYLGDFEDNSWFSAPWRSDSDPSLRVSYYNNKWVWCDFGEDSRSKTAIDFVMRYYEISYREALKKVYEDIVLNNKNNLLSKRIIKNETKSFCKIRTEFLPFELDYWTTANITKKDLNYWGVYSGEIRHNGILWHISKPGDPLFIYMFDKHIPIYKGYRPFSKDPKYKFYGKNISGHIQGWDKLPTSGDILIVTKSYKDVMVWGKLGYSAIAPHTENMFISPFDMYELQSRFNNIYVNYDNDKVGIEKSIQYSNQYGLCYFNLPTSTNCKDPFQFVICNNYNELDELFKNKLKRDGVY